MSEDSSRTHLFRAIEKRRFGASTCFLCGKRLGTKNRADEHVIPKWVQNRYSLRDQKLGLLNGTTIPYRKLTVPCCVTCNKTHLQPFETKVARAVAQGYEAVAGLDALTLFIWLGKMFYGLLYREFFLPVDRRLRRRGKIVSKQALKAYSLHHLFLQASRIPFQFHPDLPASIFVFPVLAPPHKAHQWDFRDSYVMMTMAVRIGEVGILGALQDGGAQRDVLKAELARYQKHPLHPLQFQELTAAFFYKASLLDRVPKFMVLDTRAGVQVVQSPLAGYLSTPIFNDWEQTLYAEWLAKCTQLPLGRVLVPPNLVASWLHDGRGNVQQLDFAAQPWPPHSRTPSRPNSAQPQR